MMTQELNVCVLSAPLAAIDRRALSQAWYSALHCASSDGAQTPAPALPRSPVSLSGRKRALQTQPRDADSGKVQTATPARDRSAAKLDRNAGLESERRARRSVLARRIERTFLDPRRSLQRATFSAGRKRVHVMVQASGGRVRLVAVCAPALRETVARALAQARFALASRGVLCS